MGRFTLVSAVALLMAAVPVLGQSVFRCKSADGTWVFAQSPCADDAEEIQVRVVKPPDEQLEEAARLGAQATQRSRIAAEEEQCVRRAEGAIYGPANARIADLERRAAVIRATQARVNNNLAGATYDSGLRQELGAIQQAISSERASASAAASSERMRCADQRRRREDEARRAEEDSGG